MKDIQPIGEKLSPVLLEIEAKLWEYEAHSNDAPNFKNEALRSSCKILSAVALDNLFKLAMNEQMSIEDASNMAESFGKELRKLIHTYTGEAANKWYE